MKAYSQKFDSYRFNFMIYRLNFVAYRINFLLYRFKEYREFFFLYMMVFFIERSGLSRKGLILYVTMDFKGSRQDIKVHYKKRTVSAPYDWPGNHIRNENLFHRTERSDL